MKSSIFWICPWWGFAAKTMMLPQGPPNFSIRAFLSKSCTCSIIILDSYDQYCILLHQTDFAIPFSMENSYPRIVRFAPYFQKQSKYVFTVVIKFSFISSVTLLFNLVYLCISLLCFSSLNVIKFVKNLSYQDFFGLYSSFPYCWKSNTPSSMLFA